MNNKSDRYRIADTRSFIRASMLAALACVLTMFPQIPTPTGGYVHFGDCIIYLASALMGPLWGAAVGAVGHSVADIISGHAIFALPTFIIKGLAGFAAGKIMYGRLNKKNFVLSGIACLLIVTVGYFIAEIPMFGVEAAAVSFISSPVQWLMSMVASVIIIPAVNKIVGGRM